MTLLHGYITREVLKFFFLVLSLVIGIFVAVDYLGTMDEFIQAEISLHRALLYVVLKIPFVAGQFIPVALLLSVLIVFGLMSRNNEITALKSSGISIYCLVRPVMAVSIGLAFFLVILSEFAAPISMQKSNEIKLFEIRKENLASYKKENIWMKDNRQIIHVPHFQPDENSVFEVTIYIFDDNYRLTGRVDAEKGVYRDRRWLLYGIMEQTLDKATGNYRISFHEQKVVPLPFQPEDLQAVMKKSAEMNFMELSEYINKVEEEGYDATSYRVDLYAKTAFPFVCIIMGLIGTGLSARGKLDKGLAVGISYGIGIAFFYWVFYNFCLSLGYGELLPPFIAAWITNMIFMSFGAVYILNAE
ncbi:MAG: LPS export ABC transporter permease LptG [Thermodesulfobacteriota bacterium]